MVFLKTYLDLMVFGTLGFMSFLSVWLAIERMHYYRRVKLIEYDHANELNVLLTRNLTVIYSIGANAPYVGLLGTVLGILITFYDLGQGGDIDPATIMLGLALALKATAAGLFVAIPAILAYNALLRKVDVLTAMWDKQQSQKLL
ncbi:MAG: TonB-system energizer ExbB [Gammaproteobacteria bacterium]|nr:TonB-system energizer ExbB [Gammaproteobacteria bacterium]